MRPLGVRVVRSTERFAAFVGMNDGLVLFDKPTPAANARRLNYFGEAD